MCDLVYEICCRCMRPVSAPTVRRCGEFPSCGGEHPEPYTDGNVCSDCRASAPHRQCKPPTQRILEYRLTSFRTRMKTELRAVMENCWIGAELGPELLIVFFQIRPSQQNLNPTRLVAS